MRLIFPVTRAGFSCILLIALCIVLLSPSVNALPDQASGKMKLLAVSESSKGMQGSIADLSLEVRPGQGRVFLETFPPTKEDTQISMRFAKQIACSKLDIDCSGKDFIYTIRAGPGIVGGPSAGAAAAVLTMSVLSGAPMREDVAMTGTINSGGIVGPVGGLKSKVKAASRSGMKIALIPFGTRMYKEKLLVTVTRTNQTDTESEYDGEEAGSDESCGEESNDTQSKIEDVWESISNKTNSTQKTCESDTIPIDDIGPGDGPPPAQKDDPVPLIIANFTIPKNVTLNFTRTVTRSIDLIEFGKNLGIEVREVSTIDDAIVPFTGKNASSSGGSLAISQDYIKVMRNISADMCGRSSDLESEWRAVSNDSRVPKARLKNASRKNDSAAMIGESLIFNESRRLIDMAENASSRGDFYSAASYCFRSNIAFMSVVISKKNLTKSQAEEAVDDFGRQISALRTSVQTRRVNTITDIQASMIVLERLDEAQKLLENFGKAGDSANPAPILAYVQERLYSAKAWSRFLGSSGASYTVDERSLQQSCQDKLTEAQERYEYVNYYIPNSLAGVQKSIERATAISRDGAYQRCLHLASLAKAEANLIGSLIGANRDSLPKILDLKLSVVKDSIARTQSHGSFPILAYSYYEYANSLKDGDINSALLFAEYALEVANLDIYFERVPSGDLAADESKNQNADFLTGSAIREDGAPSVSVKSFVFGFLVGVVLMVAIAVLSRQPSSRQEEY